jgi:hypothetical protein
MKAHWRKSDFWELSVNSLQEDFWDNESLALDYLNWKFGEEITQEIKNAVAKQLTNSNYEKR